MTTDLAQLGSVGQDDVIAKLAASRAVIEDESGAVAELHNRTPPTAPFGGA